MFRAQSQAGVVAFVLAAAMTGSATAAPPPAQLDISTAGRSIKLSTTTPAAGPTTITFSTTNRSAGPSLIRLEPGVTVARFSRRLDALAGPPDGLQKYGAFVSGAEIARGHARKLTIVLRPATYVVADTDGASPKKFARTSFTVSPGSPTAPLPATVSTIRLKDFGFSAPATIRRGLVRVVNTGHQMHFVDAIRVPKNGTAARIVSLLRAGQDSKVRLPDTSLLGLVSPGTVNLASVDLAPGTYVLACFYGSAGSHGKEHTMLGMERTIHVR